MLRMSPWPSSHPLMDLDQLAERWRGLRAAPLSFPERRTRAVDPRWSLVDLVGVVEAADVDAVVRVTGADRDEVELLRRMAEQWPVDRRGRASFDTHVERIDDPARFILVVLTPGQREVYDVIRKLGGATTERIMKHCPHQKKADTRRVELTAGGLIEALPKKVLTESGRLAQQWVIIEPEEVERRRHAGGPQPPKPESKVQRDAFDIIERLATRPALRKAVEDFVADNKVDRLARRTLISAVHEIGAELRQLRQERKAAAASGAGAVELNFIDRKTQLRETVELLKAIQRQLNADHELPTHARFGTRTRRKELRAIADDLAVEAAALLQRFELDDNVIEQ